MSILEWRDQTWIGIYIFISSIEIRKINYNIVNNELYISGRWTSYLLQNLSWKPCIKIGILLDRWTQSWACIQIYNPCGPRLDLWPSSCKRKGRTNMVSKQFNDSELPGYLWKDKRDCNIWKKKKRVIHQK
jgi:hypothetical protein